MDISDVQVSDKDGYKSRSNRVKACSKIVRERIWKLDSRFASKIVFQPLEIVSDAQLHRERVISVRKEAELASRVLREKCARWNADTLETSCQCDDEEFQELITVAQKTVATPQVPR